MVLVYEINICTTVWFHLDINIIYHQGYCLISGIGLFYFSGPLKVSYCLAEEFVIRACGAVFFSFYCFLDLASLLLELFMFVFKGFGTLSEVVRSTRSGEVIQLVALLAPFPVGWTIAPFFMSSCSSAESTSLWSLGGCLSFLSGVLWLFGIFPVCVVVVVLPWLPP